MAVQGMIDNRMISHGKGGIESKLQKEKPKKTWQDGSMSGGMHASDRSFKRSSEGSLTPRKA